MLKPGQLVKITTLFEDKRLPVEVRLDDDIPNLNHVYAAKYDSIPHGTIGMYIRESVSILLELEQIDSLDVKLTSKNIEMPIFQVLYYFNGILRKGWVIQGNIEPL
jgi:hypothetical protein